MRKELCEADSGIVLWILIELNHLEKFSWVGLVFMQVGEIFHYGWILCSTDTVPLRLDSM